MYIEEKKRKENEESYVLCAAWGAFCSWLCLLKKLLSYCCSVFAPSLIILIFTLFKPRLLERRTWGSIVHTGNISGFALGTYVPAIMCAYDI